MKKFLAMLLAVLMLVSLMTACGSKADEPVVENNEGGEEAAPAEKERILNFCGQLGDFQFGDMAQSITLQLAEEYNMEQVCVEYGTDTSTCVTMLMDAADQGYDYIVTSSWNVADAILADSGLYPDTDWLVFDTGPDYVWDNENVYGVAFGQNEASFITAVYEAAMTKTGVIGVLIRNDTPILNDFYAGWLHGARYAKNELGFDISWANAYLGGTTVSDAYETAIVMLQNNTDIVFSVAGNLILGTTQVMEEKGGLEAGYMTIGVDMDQYEYFANPELAVDAPGYETIVTSMIKCVEEVVRAMYEGINDGTLEPGNKFYGIADKGVDLVVNDHYLEVTPQSAQDTLAQAKQDIIDGKVKPLSFYDFPDYDTFAKYRDDPSFDFAA